MFRFKNNSQQGFTIIEVIISTAIFITVVSAMLTLFTYTLRINRRVQSLREVVQSSRQFTETFTREIRNGRIDYSTWTAECNDDNYQLSTNKSLALTNKDGDKFCYYLNASDGKFYLKKRPAGSTTTGTYLVFEGTSFRIIPATFKIHVVPNIDPNPAAPPYPEQQPFVTIAAQFEISGNDVNPTLVNYQTTISTDVYDIFNQN